MSRTWILYKDIPPGADEDAAVTHNGAQPFAEPAQLPFGQDHDAILTGELNEWGLDGTFVPSDGQTVVFWSTAQSGADGSFPEGAEPVITLDFDEQYASTGITLAFDETDRCTQVNVKWYQQETLRADADFALDDATQFCAQKVLSYDRIVLTLKATALPYRFAKLERVYLGVYRRFEARELRKASITNELDPLSVELPVSQLDWRLDSREDVDFLFQFRQPVEAHSDDALIGVYYIDKASRVSERVYDLTCQDAFGVLDNSTFDGGVYTDKSAAELLTEIVAGAFSLTVTAEDTPLTGILQPCTRREALQQVLFAWGVCGATDGGSGIRVFALPEEDPADIGPARTFPTVSVETSSAVTAVRVTAHRYTQAADGDVEVGGVKYADAQTVYTVTNPDVTASDLENVVEVTEATLVSPDNGQAAAQRVFDYYARRSETKAKLVWRGERLGALVTVPNSWGGQAAGHLKRMELTLSNTVAANCEVLQQ